MNILSAPFKLFKRNKNDADLSIGSYSDSTSDDLKEHKLTSGWLVKDSEEDVYAPSRNLRIAGWGLAVISAISGVLSMFSLPFILLTPTRFCFTLSLCILSALISIIMLKGKLYVKESLFAGNMKYYSITLIGSNIIGTVVAWSNYSAVLCLLLALVQIISLTYVALIRVPYGKECLDSFYGATTRMCKSFTTTILFRRNK